MSPTVHELQNRIRRNVGRFEREVDAQFTKEELVAIADAVGGDLEGRRPSKATMRATIRRQVGIAEGEEAGGQAFAKADLEGIAVALEGE